MPRRMSCSLTIDAVKNRTKTVTRRDPKTWLNLMPGDRLRHRRTHHQGDPAVTTTNPDQQPVYVLKERGPIRRSRLTDAELRVAFLQSELHEAITHEARCRASLADLFGAHNAVVVVGLVITWHKGSGYSLYIGGYRPIVEHTTDNEIEAILIARGVDPTTARKAIRKVTS